PSACRVQLDVPAVADLRVAVRLRVDSANADNVVLVSLLQGTTRTAQIRIDHNRYLSLEDGQGATCTAATTQLQAGTWYQVLLQAAVGSGGAYQVYDDTGVAVGSGGSCAAISVTGNLQSVELGSAASADVDVTFDDLDIHSGANPGNVRWRYLQPTGNYQTCNATSTGSSDCDGYHLWQCVNEDPLGDADTTSLAVSQYSCTFSHGSTADKQITDPIHGTLVWVEAKGEHAT